MKPAGTLGDILQLTVGQPRVNDPPPWIDPRWLVLVFGGAGKIAPAWSDIGSSETVWAGGFGFRYLLARKLRLQAGVDFGFGPSRHRTVYIRVGSTWK